jgi:nucleoside-diphosphate-sugar epimerase
MKKIIVVGATGRLGRVIVEGLKDYEVIRAGRSGPDLKIDALDFKPFNYNPSKPPCCPNYNNFFHKDLLNIITSNNDITKQVNYQYTFLLLLL